VSNVDLAITSMGMITSVGLDAITACAAIRAGITLPRPIEHFERLNEDTQEVEPLLGHSIRGITEGFVFVGCWRRMALAAIEDLVKQGNLPDAASRGFWAGTGLIAATPPLDDRYADDRSVAKDAASLKDAYLGDLLGLPVAPAHVEVLSLGHAGTAAAVRLAQQRIASGMERVIVLAADSYLDPFTLDWLAARRRLKLEGNPCGLAPGEAAACFLVESEPIARRRGAAIQGSIAAAAVGQEPLHFLQDEGKSSGAALAATIGQALAQASPDAPFNGDVVVDLNGEIWRAAEWSQARARLAKRLGEGVRLVMPAASLGETGAAGGAVGVCLATRSFARDPGSRTQALVVSSAEQGHVGAVIIKASSQGR
jgi:3-oxoacyl-[acyl-carrier-protein] synthase I